MDRRARGVAGWRAPRSSSPEEEYHDDPVLRDPAAAHRANCGAVVWCARRGRRRGRVLVAGSRGCPATTGHTPMHDFVPWAIAGGVIGGHLMHLFLYHPEELHGPLGALQILKVWDGLSSTGGVIGGALAAVLGVRARRLRVRQYGDVLGLGTAAGRPLA